jgi:hypothetical protein
MDTNDISELCRNPAKCAKAQSAQVSPDSERIHWATKEKAPMEQDEKVGIM